MAQRFDELISGRPTGASTADRGRTERATGRLWILQVLGIWLVARAITTSALLLIQTQLVPTSRGAGATTFFDYSAIWDGQWYWLIAASGYPTELPLTASGAVGESQWAFMPVYPFVAGGLAAVTGMSWPAAGVTVATASGFAASLVLYLLFRTRVPHGSALFSVALVAVGPVAFIYQMAYAESMQLFLLALALLLLVRRRWGWLVPVIAVMAMTRPTGLAFALGLAIYFVVRYLHRETDPFPSRERRAVLALTGYSGVMGLAWAGIAWAVTGSITAYTDTELAWRSAWIGEARIIPFSPWFEAAPFWVGSTAGPFVVIAIAIAFAALMITRRARALGPEMHSWVVAYGVYLFAVFFPQSSTLRLLLPMFPLAAVLAPRRSKVAGGVILALALAGQLAWLWFTWGPVSTWWSVP